MAGNRTGKTETGAYELTCHLTGTYPDWWRGKRFSKPISAWACGTTNGTIRDIVQEKLLGPEGARGTGMIPAQAIVRVSNKQGLPNAADSVSVLHVSGDRSRVSFKSYESGRKSFEGTAQEVIWLDEESPLDIYIEYLYRTATTGGVLYTIRPSRRSAVCRMCEIVPGTGERRSPGGQARHAMRLVASASSGRNR
jgi:phage terminase large subunit-like protein